MRSLTTTPTAWCSRRESEITIELPWLHWWDNQGILLLTGWERSEPLTAKLRELGINPVMVV